MPNTASAKKALRQSYRKRSHNLFWKKRIRSVIRDLKKLLRSKGVSAEVLQEKIVLLQKYADKATKEKVISRNKANRLKSRYAHKISAYTTARAKGSKPVASADSSVAEATK